MDDNKLNQCNTNIGTDNNTLTGYSDNSSTLNTNDNVETDKCNTDKPIKDMSKIGNGNLKPLNMRTMEERREIAILGGKKSGEARKLKKDLRTIAREVMSMQLNDVQIEDFLNNDSNLVTDDKSVAYVATAKLAINALSGDNKAYETLRDTAGFKPKDQMEIETITDGDRALMENLAKRLKPV